MTENEIDEDMKSRPAKISLIYSNYIQLTTTFKNYKKIWL